MQVTVQDEINASAKAVWQIITDIEHAPEFLTGVDEVEILEPAKDGIVGLKWRETRTMFGKSATEVMWITDAVDGTSYDTRAESHGAIYTTRISLEDRQGKTGISMTFEGQAVTFGAKLMWGLMGWMFKGPTKKAFQADLDDIKRAAEANA